MLAAVRASHEHFDLGVLDLLTRDADRLPALLAELNSEGEPLAGWVVIATCNRLEVYLDAHRFHDGVDLVVEAVTATSGLDRDLVALCLETAMGDPVAENLFEVTAGLRSIVIGEAEIAGQIRTAFEASRAAGHSTAMLNDLFQISFRHAKKVAARTPVGVAGRSGVAVALDRAEELLGPIAEQDVLVIGTGAYARLGVADLTRRGARRVRVHSRSGRAVGFAQRHGVEGIAGEELGSALREADLVLACSGRGTSLFPEHFRTAGPTLVLDLALHSDLHPLVRRLDEVRVLDLSDLSAGSDAASTPALEAARAVIAAGVDVFSSRQEMRRVDPAISLLRRSVEGAAESEIAQLRRSGKDEAADDVARSIRRILAKVMHSPTVRAREHASQGHAGEFVDALHTVFGVDIAALGAGAGQRGEGEADRPRGWMRLDQTIPPGPARAELARLSRAASGPGDGAFAGGCPLSPAQQQAFLQKVQREGAA